MTDPVPDKKLIIRCSQCGCENEFLQPYRYHAGFGDTGFLYNKAGNSTLTWNAYDPFFSKLFPNSNPWSLNSTQKQEFEAILPLSPKGDRWLFAAPARCFECTDPISASMEEDIYYVLYLDSVRLNGADRELRLEWYVKKDAAK